MAKLRVVVSLKLGYGWDTNTHNSVIFSLSSGLMKWFLLFKQIKQISLLLNL